MSIGLYTFGRLGAVATRPLCLFIANNHLSSPAAQGLAVAFLASALALAGIAADPHRRFYSRLFDAKHDINGLSFYLYAASLVVLVGLGCAIVFAVGFHFTNSLLLAGAGIVYFISEKLTDELLRLRLFERDFSAWGRSAIARSVLQIGGFVAMLGIAGTSTPAWLVVLLLATANLVVFVPQLPPKLGQTLRARSAATFTRLVGRAVRSLRGNQLLWAVALLGGGIGYLDRIISLVLDRAVLPLFMLIVACFSVVQMAVDFFYISRHRREFLERRIPMNRAFGSREFLGSLGIGLLLAIVACAIAIGFSRNGAAFPLGYVLVIAVLQLSLAIATVPQQILYWEGKIDRMFHIELAFWIVFLCAALATWWLSLSVGGVFALVAVCALLRLAFYVMVASHRGMSAS